MKNSIDYIKDLLIIILLVVLVFQKECTPKRVDSSSVHYHNTYDTSHYHFHFNVVNPVDSHFVMMPQVFDTMAALRKLYSTFFYCDTLSDSNMIAIIKESISQNRIIKRDFSYQWKRPLQIIQIDPVKHKNKLYAGVFGGFSQVKGASLGPELILISKKDHCYKLNTDLINRGFEVGIHRKISIKRQ